MDFFKMLNLSLSEKKQKQSLSIGRMSNAVKVWVLKNGCERPANDTEADLQINSACEVMKLIAKAVLPQKYSVVQNVDMSERVEYRQTQSTFM